MRADANATTILVQCPFEKGEEFGYGEKLN